VVFTDLRLLLLPVRSLLGTFAWVTSPYILQRLARDVNNANHGETPKVTPLTATDQASITYTSAIVSNKQIYLEDLDLKAGDTSANEWSTWLGQQIFSHDPEWQEELSKRFCIVHDDVFSFLAKHGTEINARIKINPDTHTVDSKKGALWYEECLPTESVLSGILLVQPNSKTDISNEKIAAHLTQLTNHPLQLGGKSTVGRGICRVTISGGA
jgi:CRISPR-associated protein Cmr4